MEFSTSSLFLEFCFFECRLSGKIIKLFSDFLIFSSNVIEVGFSGIKVMFIFSTVKASVEFLYYFSLFHEESRLFVFIFVFFSRVELETAGISSPDSLDPSNCLFFILELPFLPKHSHPFLDSDSCRIVKLTLFLCLIDSFIVLIYDATVSFFSLFQEQCHFYFNFFIFYK